MKKMKLAKRTLIQAALACAICSGAGARLTFADVPEAYPGSLWTIAASDLNGVEGFRTQGNLSQGVQWLTLPGGIPAQTYLSYRWRFRTENKPFFDAHGPAIGAMFSKWFLNFGAEYEWQDYPSLGTSTKSFVLFLSWYDRTDWISGDQAPSLLGLPVRGFPTATWGRVTFDFDNIEGLGTMGFVSQGIEWVKLPGDIVFRTVALYHWRFRTKNTEFYNVHGPGLGVELGRDSLDLGAEYSWRTYPGQQTANEFQLYLTYYLGWDLAQL